VPLKQNLYRRKMRVAELVGFARRMQWIREQQKSIALESVGSQHRRSSSAHRSSADYQLLRLDLLTDTPHDGGDAVFEARHRIWATGLFLLVEKVEADDAESAGAESVGGLKDSAIVHVSARAVGANKGGAVLSGFGRLIDRRRLVAADAYSPFDAINGSHNSRDAD
jgi:hypothetical protein